MMMALLLSSALLLLVFYPILLQLLSSQSSEVFEWLASQSVTAAFDLSLFLASSILVLRLTHALADRRRDKIARAVESRSEQAGSLCCVLIVVAAGLIQPSAWSQPSTVGWGLGAMVIALLAVVFQFYLGTVYAPDARVQRNAEELTLRSYGKTLASLTATGVLSRRRAVIGLVMAAVVPLLGVPLLFQLLTWSTGSDAPTGGLVLVLLLMSGYGIALGQFAQTISSTVRRRLTITGTAVFGLTGWGLIAVFEFWGYIVTGDTAWLLWAVAFLFTGLVCCYAILTRRVGRGGWTLRAAVATVQTMWLSRRISASAARVQQLNQIIDAERPLRKTLRALRWWLRPDAGT